ncbi:MAG TPA: 4'-phosphopantetheinyl transferase superfamily protein [Polyangia bacterium]
MAFERRFVRELPFGTCVGISLPAIETARGDDDPFDLPPILHADEAAFARGLSPFRRAGWVGGRVALRAALTAIAFDAPAPIFATPRGAPALPPGVVGSVSHKNDLAVALVARASGASAETLGIDVEVVRSLKHDIARHVLTSVERAALPPPGPARDAEVLLLFSAKEAIYKALDPRVQRFVSFQEAQIAHAPGGALAARLTLAQGEGPFAVELDDASAADVILVAARITPGVA